MPAFLWQTKGGVTRGLMVVAGASGPVVLYHRSGMKQRFIMLIEKSQCLRLISWEKLLKAICAEDSILSECHTRWYGRGCSRCHKIKAFASVPSDGLSNTSLALNQALDSITNLNQRHQKFPPALECKLNFQPRKLPTPRTMYSNCKAAFNECRFPRSSMESGRALGAAEMKGLLS